jgi:glycosyltransferase involved in cell wall biosynthesis
VNANGAALRAASRPPVVLDARVVTGTGGGPEKTILSSPRFLARHGYRMLCAYLHPPGDPGFEQLAARALALEAPLVSVSDRGPLDVSVVRELLMLCKRERVAVYHGHDYKTNALGLLLRPFWPMRLVTTVHGWVRHTKRTPLYYALDRLCLRRYEKVICVSQDLYEACLRMGVPDEACVLLENGIDTESYARRRAQADAKRGLGVPSERLLIGAVGRLSAEKGFANLICAADRLLASGADVELWIAGDGDRRHELQSLVERLGRTGRVRLLGFQSDVKPLFEAMDVFALSSIREGLPNVVLEAMALEVPVVATRVAGVPKLIEHGRNGWLAASPGVDDLAHALAAVLGDAQLRRALAQEGRRTVETSYSFAARVQKLAALYDSLLRRRAADAPPPQRPTSP